MGLIAAVTDAMELEIEAVVMVATTCVAVDAGLVSYVLNVAVISACVVLDMAIVVELACEPQSMAYTAVAFHSSHYLLFIKTNGRLLYRWVLHWRHRHVLRRHWSVIVVWGNCVCNHPIVRTIVRKHWLWRLLI